MLARLLPPPPMSKPPALYIVHDGQHKRTGGATHASACPSASQHRWDPSLCREPIWLPGHTCGSQRAARGDRCTEPTSLWAERKWGPSSYLEKGARSAGQPHRCLLGPGSHFLKK